MNEKDGFPLIEKNEIYFKLFLCLIYFSYEK